MIEFPGFCHEKKDIFGLFWKNCFYKHIEEFRKSIKRLKGQIDIARSNDKIYHLARLSQEFSAFINDSSRFIQKLMTDVSFSFSFGIFLLITFSAGEEGRGYQKRAG